MYCDYKQADNTLVTHLVQGGWVKCIWKIIIYRNGLMDTEETSLNMANNLKIIYKVKDKRYSTTVACHLFDTSI